MESVILLNMDYGFLDVIGWKKAIKLMVKEKVEVVEATEKVLMNAEKTCTLVIPKILRLVNLVRKVYKSRVPYSKRNVHVRDNFTCCYCGSTQEALSVDHVVPQSRGGKTCFENCVSSCMKCNSKKNDRTPSEAGMFLSKQPYQPTVMEFLSLKMKKLNVYDTLKELGLC